MLVVLAFQGMANIIPKETLVWKLKLLKTASAYTNSRLHAIKAEVLVLARSLFSPSCHLHLIVSESSVFW